MKNEVPTELQFSGTGVTDNSINQMNDNQSILTLKQYDMHKPDNIIFKNRKEAKKYFGTNKYYKIEREKKDIIFIDDHKSIATNGGNQTDIDK